MRYIIGLLVTIGLIVLIFVLLLRGSGPGPVVHNINLDSYAGTNATAELIIDGPIVSEQIHNEAQIIVGNNSVTFNLYKGYNGNLVNTKTYANNESAYAVFLHALDNYGFTKGNADKALSDERGQCATGLRYIYTLNNNGEDIERYWSTSCGTGTFKGKSGTIIDLFRKQVPDYGTLVANTDL
jgi:hypothetical protein